MRVRTICDTGRNLVQFARIKAAPFVTPAEDDSFAAVRAERYARTIEMVSADRYDDAGANVKRLGQNIGHVFDRAKEKFCRVFKDGAPRKFMLPRRQPVI